MGDKYDGPSAPPESEFAPSAPPTYEEAIAAAAMMPNPASSGANPYPSIPMPMPSNTITTAPPPQPIGTTYIILIKPNEKKKKRSSNKLIEFVFLQCHVSTLCQRELLNQEWFCCPQIQFTNNIDGINPRSDDFEQKSDAHRVITR